MDKEEMIAADLFCASHNIEVSFLHSLCNSGLLEVTTIENTVFISNEHLPDLERLVRWHYDMDINLEGLETISHLLHRIKGMQQEMQNLKSRLGLYEKIE
jgi:hypothetical protein